ncbi:anthocyanidin 3-O-glucosyltransferase 7-like isoform X2 [Lotus japonicus]|uniref:anthocyanidin 3-O-glucosyltransferase 7-like isoform X2 n=1 Tax=Lotus japonicus TaxID=34305 RepID=UPI00258A3FFA|nr:anthocyanidin 3-O-glucosyltransferase 7-like isoform X2 [Lotus japonicus]
MANPEENKHVAVFPFPFSSHILPVFNLALKLAHALPTSSFSFITTENSMSTLSSSFKTKPDNLNLYTAISDGTQEGHSYNPIEIVELFLQTGPENFQKGLDIAVAETKKPVTSIIADAFVTPTFDVAQALNVPWIPVWIPVSCSLSVHFYGDKIRAHVNINKSKTLDFLPGLPMLRVEDLPHDVLMSGTEKENVLTKTLVSLSWLLPQAKALVVSFFEELDPPDFVHDMRSNLQSMLYVPLFTTLSPPIPMDDDATGCLSWLDTQQGKSVVYVSFGTTVVQPPQHELVAIAEALEESGFPFIWSLKDNLKGLLPKGFIERTSTRGKVLPWVPQARILSHGSVGAFVSQGGCNSTMEGMSNGVPMIFRPYFADQGMNARLGQDVWGIGIIIEGREFTKTALLNSLNLILVKEEGKKFRENCSKMNKIIQDAAGPKGSAVQDFKTLVDLISSP